MSMINWAPLAPPRVNEQRQEVSLKNDTFHVNYRYFPGSDSVCRSVCLVSAKRLEEARRFGMPQQWAEIMGPKRANAQIEELLIEAHRLNGHSSAFYVVEEES